MYWADVVANKVQRANFDGSGVEDLLTVTGSKLGPVSIALDLVSRKMYLGLVDVMHSMDGKVQRANLDGSAVEDLIQFPPLILPYALALDVTRDKLYWILPGIQRSNLDGAGVELIITDVLQPGGIALDLRRNEIPALSEWGLLVMGVVVVLTGCVVLGRRRISTQAAPRQAIG